MSKASDLTYRQANSQEAQRVLAKARARDRARQLAEKMTDEEDASLTRAALSDPDNPPFGDDVRLVSVEKVRQRPGRPRVPSPKQQITLRIDPEVIEHFKATGPGWQGRINDALKDAVKKAS